MPGITTISATISPMIQIARRTIVSINCLRLGRISELPMSRSAIRTANLATIQVSSRTSSAITMPGTARTSPSAMSTSWSCNVENVLTVWS